MAQYVLLFDDISKNLNILREVRKPSIMVDIDRVID